MRSLSATPLLVRWLILVAWGIRISAAVGCGNGQFTCEYKDGQAPSLKRCSWNRWYTAQCCGSCSGNECISPSSLKNGKCPLSGLSESCKFHEQCANSRFCVLGTCQDTQGRPGEPCKPGKSKCELKSSCSPTENKCVYGFRQKCDIRFWNGCARVEGLSKDTTVACVNNPASNIAGDTRCLPLMSKGGKCLSDKDCVTGKCTNGKCPQKLIPDGGICRDRAGEYCAEEGSVCGRKPSEWPPRCGPGYLAKCKHGGTPCVGERSCVDGKCVDNPPANNGGENVDAATLIGIILNSLTGMSHRHRNSLS